MTPVRLSVQTLVVLLLVVFVSLPDYARLKGAVRRARTSIMTSQPERDAGASGHTAGRKYEIGYGSMSIQRAAATGGSAVQQRLRAEHLEAARKQTPAAVLVLGGRINAIVGEARTALNAPVPFARLVLRNPVTGRIEARATADDAGQFTFLDIMPTAYIVELVGPNESVSATSDLVTVGVGEVRQAIVRLPASREMLGTFGAIAPTANDAVTAAAESGINAVTAPDRSVSPQR